MDIDFAAIRAESTRRCREAGFTFSPSLPLGDAEQATLRPKEEIARRLAALAQLCAYVLAPEHKLPESRVRNYIDMHGLRAHLTPGEGAILDQSRDEAHEEHAGNIGWKMENAWALGWILGFEPEPRIDGQMVSDEVGPLFTRFVPKEPEEFGAALEEYTLRPVEQVIQLEDLFYCVHNAARSAYLAGPRPRWRLGRRPPQFGPDGFDPVVNGGVIQERRHALTWALSPGVEWDETDLST